MKFEIGDKILLLHSKEEGTVVDIINADMVMVEVGKVTFPVYLDQIDFPYFHRFTTPKPAPPPQKIQGYDIKPEKKKYEDNIRMSRGMFLSILPVFRMDAYEEHVQSLKFHLLNETSEAYRFNFQVWLRNSMEMEIRNEIQPFSNFYLSDLLFESLNDSPRLEFVFFPKEKNDKLAPSFPKTWKPKVKQLFLQLSELQARRDATLSQLLFEKYPEKSKNDKPYFDASSIGSLSASGTAAVPVAPEPPAQPKYELDLHIEMLVKEWRGLKNIEILAIQLNEFVHYLELAIVHHQHSMIVIHGVGKGKLKDEIHAILRDTPEVERFVNEYHPRYGYGATEIFFRH
ncbi:Smr/MutS family protein [Chitinophaga filiformis]|uniref:Smr domain-containing protein n=1 Tax=Chitinophaga filiformis TaxID=104663 RepID=A0ABY4HU56_CHIFI|nr:Smr/MutS family protein [Chitinophaga filiformis]UPK67127.1 hypothetical protein MYF79_19500 [Chitinophaga filiformis]